MENNNENDKFWSLKKMLFKDDFLEQNKTESKDVVEKPVEQKEVSPSKIVSAPLTGSPDADLMNKIYNALEASNLPGIDFMELWNSMRAMGSVDVTNLRSSFTALKIASGNTLSKESLIETGGIYLTKISDQLESDIALKEKNYAAKQAELKQNKTSLETNRNDIYNKIKEYQDQLAKAEKELSEIDSKYAASFTDISTKITHGKIAKQKISEEINSIITLIKTNL
jgi:hypothetical protein